MKYQVINKKTGTVEREYDNPTTARKCRDRLDCQYGAYVHYVKAVA